MSSITKVAIAGATGSLGEAILNELLKAGFSVKVLTRQGSTHTFPTGVTVAKVDYDSVDGLTAALHGQDGVVSTLGPQAFKKQLNLVEAAVNAGVKRFLPSEFGSDLANPKNATFPTFADKVATQKALEEKAKSTQLSYTAVRNGAFLDQGIKVGFIINLPRKRINLFDGGDHKFSTTTLPSIGKAVVGIFKHPEETKNRAVYIHSTVTSAKELLAKAKKVAGEDGWTENVVAVDDLVAGAWAELKKEHPIPEKFVFPFIQASIWGGEAYGSPFPKVDNELLGVEEITDAELLALLSSYAK